MSHLAITIRTTFATHKAIAVLLIVTLAAPSQAQTTQTCQTNPTPLNVTAVPATYGLAIANVFRVNTTIALPGTSYWLEVTILGNSVQYVAPNACISTKRSSDAFFWSAPLSAPGLTPQPKIASYPRTQVWSVAPGANSVALPINVAVLLPNGVTCAATNTTRKITLCLLVRTLSHPAATVCWSSCTQIVSLEFTVAANGAVISSAPQTQSCW